LKQALQLPAATPFDIVVPNDLQVEELSIDKSREEIFDMAKESLPEVKSAYAKVQSSTYAVKIARSNLIPRLTAQASINSNYSSANDFVRFQPDKDDSQFKRLTLAEYTALSDADKTIIQFQPIGYQEISDGVYGLNYSFIQPTGSYVPNGYGDQLHNNIYKSIGLSLSIPIFNGFQARLGVRRSLISQRIAEVNAKQINNTLRQNVETAYNDAFAAAKTYNSNLRQVQAREEAFRMMKQRFEIGASNYVEYQISENDLFRAKSDLARAKYNFIFRKKLLDFYQGKPLGL
jgi:outer membrane protein